MLKKYEKVFRFSFYLANMALYTTYILTHSHTHNQQCLIYIQHLGSKIIDSNKLSHSSFHLKIENQYKTSYIHIFHQVFQMLSFSQGTKSYFLILVSSIKNDTVYSTILIIVQHL